MDSSALTLDADHLADIDELARVLPNRAARLTRLAMGHVGQDVTPSMASTLAAVGEKPRRINELARIENLSQPRATLLVKLLEERGWVVRERDSLDRRAVQVTLTAGGGEVLDGLRQRVAAAIATGLAAMSEDQLGALLAAREAIDALLEALERECQR
jgi:DNA-binding MarR family transcriptional regulator